MPLPGLRFERTPRCLRVWTRYWQVEHDAGQGWCVNSIAVRNGRNTNLLRGPISSSFCRYRTRVPDCPEFSDRFDRTARLKIVSRSRQKLCVRVTGRLADRRGRCAPVRYETVYTYHCYGALSTTRRFFADGIRGINRISVGSMQLAGHLAEYAIRESYDDWLALPRRIWCTDYGVSFARWERVNKSAQVVFNRYSIPTYLCFFERDVEGIDVFPGSQAHQWQIRSNGTDLCSRTALTYDAGADSMTLSIDPLFETLGREPAALDGEFEFTTLIGLPHKPKRLSTGMFHVGIRSRAWPSTARIRKWAKAGVNLVRLHDDGFHPDSFWKDGSYPPYDAKNMREMDRVIRDAHRNGMRIIPYFSLLELHKDTPEFQANARDWHKIFEGSDAFLFTQAQGKGFGALMCLQSGWADCLKTQIQRVLERHEFDGVYFDWCYGPMVCDHPGHAAGRHTMIEQMLEVLYWTRRHIGPDRIMMIHQSPCALIPAENLADAVVTMEELPGDDYFLTALPHPSQLSPHARFIGIAERQICPAITGQRTWTGKPIKKNLAQAFLVRCALNNVFPYGHPAGLAPYFAIRRTLSAYRFFDSASAPVGTDNPNVPAVFYNGKQDSLIVLGNLTGKRASCVVKAGPGREKVVPDDARIVQLLPERGRACTAAALRAGLRVSLAAHELRVYRCG